MMWKVKFTHSDTNLIKQSSYFCREGKEIYRHPLNRFVVLEFQGKIGKFRESFHPEELLEV